MTETRKTKPKETSELRFVTKSLAARKPTRFDFCPDAPARAAMAAALGLIDVPALRLQGELRPVGGDSVGASIAPLEFPPHGLIRAA